MKRLLHRIFANISSGCPKGCVLYAKIGSHWICCCTSPSFVKFLESNFNSFLKESSLEWIGVVERNGMFAVPLLRRSGLTNKRTKDRANERAIKKASEHACYWATNERNSLGQVSFTRVTLFIPRLLVFCDVCTVSLSGLHQTFQCLE